jgi:hypothetical protein
MLKITLCVESDPALQKKMATIPVRVHYVDDTHDILDINVGRFESLLPKNTVTRKLGLAQDLLRKVPNYVFPIPSQEHNYMLDEERLIDLIENLPDTGGELHELTWLGDDNPYRNPEFKTALQNEIAAISAKVVAFK